MQSGSSLSSGVRRNMITLCRITVAVTFVLLALAFLNERGKLRRTTLTSTARPSYDLQIATLPGFPFSSVTALNNQGTAVGIAWTEEMDEIHSFIWRDGKAVELKRPSGIRHCIAVDINDRGDVVGAGMKDSGPVVGIIWGADRKTTIIALKNQMVFPQSINNAGTVSGLYQTTESDSALKGFLWTAGKLREIGAFQPLSLNDADDMAGVRFTGAGEKSRIEPVLYQKDKRLTILPRPRGFDHGLAYDINSRSDCVGGVFGQETTIQAVLWESGKARFLSSRPSLAYGVNDAGQAVGLAVRDFYYEAALWDGKQEIFLNDTVSRRAGWNLFAAIRVNQRGQIVGLATKGDLSQGFLLTPRK